MKFLLAIGGKEYSQPTLDIGSRIVRSFGAGLSIVYVGRKPKQIYDSGVQLAMDSLAKWEIYHPGVDVLQWAFEYLKESGFLKTDLSAADFDPKNLVGSGSRFRMVLPGSYGNDIDLILREGEIIDELRQELNKDEYFMTIIGGSKKRNMAHNLIQYLPTSIFVVQNYKRDITYKLLLLVDDSEATKRAIRFGATIAKQQKLFINMLTVSKKEGTNVGYERAAEEAGKLLKAQGVDFEQHTRIGDPVDTFIEFAGDDNILVMGASSQSPLKKFFMGSKPIKTLQRANTPILIVR